jgi:agmatine deiminase
MNTITRRIPAEWEKHEITLLSFPHDGKDWPTKYTAIKWVYIEIIKKLTRYEPVLLLVKSEKLRETVNGMLEQAHVDRKKVKFIIKDTNRSWMRDSGPIIVKDDEGRRIAMNFSFNGWAKYTNYKKDKGVSAAVASFLKIPLFHVMYNKKQVVLEGGAIDSNGCGTLLTTEECLLDKKHQVRNPGFEKKDYENVFREYLGISNVIWLGEGIEGDDTHGHVDDVCRFVNKNTVITAREIKTKDKNYNKLEDNFERLQNARLENGEKLNIVTIPMPERLDFEDLRLPASYVNFLIANGAVLVPVFNDKNDYKALGVIKDLFPNHDVIGISAVDLIWGLGTLHCLSHEIPV